LLIKPTDALNLSFIGTATLHVPGSLSAYHQEFLAVHRLRTPDDGQKVVTPIKLEFSASVGFINKGSVTMHCHTIVKLLGKHLQWSTVVQNGNIHCRILKTPTTCPIVEAKNAVQTNRSYLLITNLMISSYPRLGFLSCLFPSSFHLENFYESVLSLLHITFSSHLVLHGFIT